MLQRNFLRTVLLASLLLFAVLPALAQLQPGLRIGYTNYLRTGVHMALLGGQLEKPLNDQLGLRGSLEAGIGSAGTDEYRVAGLDAQLRRVVVGADGNTSAMLLHGGLDVRAFVSGNGYKVGGFYGILGLGLTAARANTEYEIISSLDNVVYVNGFPEEGDQADYLHLVMRGGIGYQFALGKLNAFVESKLNFPVSDQKRDDSLHLRQDVGLWFGVLF